VKKSSVQSFAILPGNATTYTFQGSYACNPWSDTCNLFIFIYATLFIAIGMGENIRGSALSAIDAIGKDGDTARNEEIVRKGRLETEQGLEAMRGQRGASPAGTSEGVNMKDTAQGPGSDTVTGTQPNGYRLLFMIRRQTIY
jgi:hypothetical protein